MLTPAEWEVVDWLRHGVTRREIAERRGTGVDAVKYHIANAIAKLGVSGTAALRQWPGYPATSALATRREHQPMTTTALRLGPIGQVALHVRDVGTAERFYRDTLGLPHIFTFGNLAFFDMAGVRLYVQAVVDEKWRPGSLLYFLVDEIHAAWDQLRARGVDLKGAPHVIYTHDDGTEEWMAFFEDPDGNQLALMSRVSPS